MDQQEVIVPLFIPFLSKTPASAHSRRGPVQGEHSEEILRKYGFSKEKIARVQA